LKTSNISVQSSILEALFTSEYIYKMVKEFISQHIAHSMIDKPINTLLKKLFISKFRVNLMLY
jgi:hypothetical protein